MVIVATVLAICCLVTLSGLGETRWKLRNMKEGGGIRAKRCWTSKWLIAKAIDWLIVVVTEFKVGSSERMVIFACGKV